MLRFTLNRVLVAIPTLLLVTVFVFMLQKLLPGDPILVLAGEDRDPETIAMLREQYRMNDPLIWQYLYWLGDVMRGDLGTSLRTGLPVTELIAQKLPVTIQLAVMSMIFAMVIGIPAGVMSAVKKGTFWDYLANIIALSGLSVPNFWLGIMLILLVSVHLGWLPASGYESPWVDPVRSFQTMLMPVDRAGHGACRDADAPHPLGHAGGASGGLCPHRARQGPAREDGDPAATPSATRCCRSSPFRRVMFGELLAGAVLTEQIFTIPGFGKMVVDAVFNRDYAVVQGVVLCHRDRLHPDQPPGGHSLCPA